MELDAVDERILQLLGEEGRRSNRELARIIGVTEGTIRSRVRRLLAENVMQIVAGVNPEWKGYSIDSSFSLRVEFDKAKDIATRLVGYPEIRFVALTTGADDIRFTAMFKSHEHFKEFVTVELAGIPGILQVRTSTALSVLKHTYDWRPVPKEPGIGLEEEDEDDVEADRPAQ
ncbi:MULTISPECIES: Lrp/AsnC family transcriptional regulator [Actinomadura]|uniref:Transcriptional regulator, AsnC family n=1 Tax=Actinomadura madurae TaxID=1993 RepID=A0A1I5DJF0_9ACTN|nr:Lrp/AsnC family transcriptional regulator [Actinomadura madurae]SFN99352.1 transcriptional regulator, AsnC family [Actinomadura madurae]SPT50325.1 Leucine-responsive regulatory protein [Actinomadura madurae]